MKKFIAIVSILCLLAFNVLSQNQVFSPYMLENPGQNRERIEQIFKLLEIEKFIAEEYSDSNVAILENDYASAEIGNKTEWAASENVIPKKIVLIYTKYPRNKEFWLTDYYDLLADRLKALFEIDPALNSDAIEWEIVLQTDCETEEKAKKLFHGIMIAYEHPVCNKKVKTIHVEIQKEEIKPEPEEEIVIYDAEIEYSFYSQMTTEELKTSVDYILKTEFPDSIKEVLSNLSLVEASRAIVSYLEEELSKPGVKNFTLFNDGMDGGIFHEDADNMDRLLQLYKMVMMDGWGGDCPENDMGALLRAIKKYPDCEQLVLIADNNSSIHDFSLIDNIDRPVKVIICGYNSSVGVNPQYVELALKTKGSVHTIEEDIDYMRISSSSGGKRKFDDSEINIGGSLSACVSMPFGGSTRIPDRNYDTIVFTDLSKAYEFRYYAKKVQLDDMEMEKIPNKIFELQKMSTLDLSGNKICKIPATIKKLKKLKSLDLSNNELTSISYRIGENVLLGKIDLSGNKLKSLPDEFYSLPNLTNLDLSGNRITSYPRIINWKKLEEINLADNKIQEFPDGLTSLRKLRYVNLSNNNLFTIPNSIKRLKKLETLDLSNNNLKELPSDISRLEELKILIISGNPIKPAELEKIKALLPQTKVVFELDLTEKKVGN